MLKIKRDGQCDLFDDNPEYAAFVDKFKPKKTTDDCYTPEPVYEAVADWVAKEFGLEKSRFLRPFYPGGGGEGCGERGHCVAAVGAGADDRKGDG